MSPVTSLVLSLAILALPDPGPGSGDSVAADVHDYLQRLEGLGFSGVALVGRDGEVLVSEGYGLADRAAGVANTPDTVFPLGSISKHFTAAAVLRLQMDGALSVDDALTLYFDDVPEDKRGITLHHLLSHTSGLPESLGPLREAADIDAWARAALGAELYFPPGTGMSYSNLGYGLLSGVVEKVAGVPFGDYLRDAVFGPAGMERTGLFVPAWERHELAHGYIDDRDTGTLLDSWGGPVPVGLRGAGGVQATAGDMLRWSRALRTGAVLDEASVAAMTTPRGRGGPDFAMGYGCGITGSPLGRRIGHSGSNDVFSAYFHHYLETDLFVFVATNNADMYSEGPIRGVESILFGESAPEAPATIRLQPDELLRYAGTWVLGGDESVTVGTRSDGLTLASSTPVTAALLHPVHPRQVARRAQLLQAVATAFTAAYGGRYEDLHALLAPQAPLDEFIQNEGGLLDELVQHHGPFRHVRTIPGRNRFGEIAVIAELHFEADVARIEYSFGEREVGSIRFLDGFPRRVVYPSSPEGFVAYDPDEDQAWHVGFELDAEGAPIGLLLLDEAGEAHVLRRAD